MSALGSAVGVLRWMRAAPAERMTLPGAVLMLAAADMLHAEEIPQIDVATGTLAVAAIAALGVKNHRHGRQAAGALATAGGWLALATHAGPLAGPDHALAWLWAGLSLGGYIALRNHDAVRDRRERRKAKHTWRTWKAASYGLPDSKLLDYEPTRLGESFVVDTRDTGRRASHLASGDLAELIAEREMLPHGRVQVRPERIAGRIRISIRYRDPWANPPLHPVLDPDRDIELPVPSTLRDPICVGIDPETGAPLLLPLWEKSGTKNVLVVGMKGAGKSVLLNNLRERITASTDAIFWDINVSKAHEDIEWLQAADLAAVTQAERPHAGLILKLAHAVIDYRSTIPRTTANFVPTSSDPLIVLIIDEIDSLVGAGDAIAAQARTDLKYIASKCRSEGVALVLAGQRATAQWIGGADVRANIDLVCIGMVRSQAEVRHAVGEVGFTFPDMATYGDGAEGVWLLTDISGNWHAGRTFDLEVPEELRQLAWDRAPAMATLPADLVAYLGETYQQLRARSSRAVTPLPQGTAAAAAGRDSTPPPDSPNATVVAVLDRPDDDPLTGLEFPVPDDLRGFLNDLDAKLADGRQRQADLDRIEIPEAPPDRVAEYRDQRWEAIASEAQIPDVKLPVLIKLLEDGTTISASAGQLEVTPWIARTWLEKLRRAGLAHIEGQGRGARWLSSPDRATET